MASDMRGLWSDVTFKAKTSFQSDSIDFQDVDAGWIPPSERPKGATEAWEEEIGVYEDQVTQASIPDRFLMLDMEMAAIGEPLPRIHQQTGSCVGAGSGVAMGQLACAEIVRGDHERACLNFFLPAYGVGRQLSGARGPGDGSWGKPQSEATQQFGLFPFDWSQHDFPRPTISKGWAKWTSKQERQWSHPSAWPIPKATLDPFAKPAAIDKQAKVTSTEGLRQALASGMACTEASNYGTSPAVRDGLLVGPWNRSWSHQMNLAGYIKINGKWYYLDYNQWNNVHGICPMMESICKAYGIPTVNGCFWIPEDDMAKIIDRGEVRAHSGTGGFDVKPFPEWKLSA